MEEDYYVDDMDMANYLHEGMTQEELLELLESYDGEIPPDVLDMLEQYEGNTEISEYSRIPLPEVFQNCIMPSGTQALHSVIPLIFLCFVFHIVCRLSNLGPKKTRVQCLLIHLCSALFGYMMLHSFFRYSYFYLVLCGCLAYMLFNGVCIFQRQWCGVAGAAFVVCFSVACELFIVEPKSWHKIRGAQIILSMKIISLGIDVAKGSVEGLPNIFEFMGYCFNVGTVILGPWISYADYVKLTSCQSVQLSVKWFLQVLLKASVSLLCLFYSNCFTHWLILDNSARWILAYRDAQSFRFSHYFISFLSDTTLSLSGLSQSDGSLDWNVARPQDVEVPRSLVEIVTSWNLPMHYWLKTYVFKTVRPHGTFVAVILTYVASSLLHGLNFQLAAVLLSLGFYSYTEFVLRKRLAKIFDACIEAKRCKAKCDHKYTNMNPMVILINLGFGVLAVFHLAYLGLMFDSSDGEEKGYTMWHTLDKWSSLNFLSHWVALSTFIFYWVI